MSPKYRTSGEASLSRIARNTVRPPEPESKIPIMSRIVALCRRRKKVPYSVNLVQYTRRLTRIWVCYKDVGYLLTGPGNTRAESSFLSLTVWRMCMRRILRYLTWAQLRATFGNQENIEIAEQLRELMAAARECSTKLSREIELHESDMVGAEHRGDAALQRVE